MGNNKKMEVFVNLTKADTIVAIDDKILPGSLVFDSLNPFPGYYHDSPTNVRPIYIYMVLDHQYPLEEIIRATQNIEKAYNFQPEGQIREKKPVAGCSTVCLNKIC